MAKLPEPAHVLLDINNPVFQENLSGLQKPDRHAAVETLNKLRHMTWNHVYPDKAFIGKDRQRRAAGDRSDLRPAHHPIAARDRLQGRRVYALSDRRSGP